MRRHVRRRGALLVLAVVVLALASATAHAGCYLSLNAGGLHVCI